MPITDDLLAKVRDLKEGREIVYGYMGVSVNNPTPRQRREAGAQIDSGLLVESVEADSPAAAVSMKPGDMLISVGDSILRDSDQFVRVVGNTAVDRAVPVKIMRDGKPLSLDVMLAPSPVAFGGGDAGTSATPLARFAARSDPGQLESRPEIAADRRDGARRRSVSPLAQGLSSGAVITAMAGKPVDDLISLQRIINDTPAEQCKLGLAAPPEANLAHVEP